MEKEKGFSLIEFLVVMALMVILFAAAFGIFVPVIVRSKIESGNVQSQIEGIIGLELLRRDVVHAGLGIPWTLPSGFAYQEATDADRAAFNDATSNPPRPLIVENAIATAGLGLNNSDYLVVKSAMVANPVTTDGTNYVGNPASDRWTTVRQNGVVRVWNSVEDDLQDGERVIVLQPASTQGAMLLTVDAGGSFFTQFSSPLDVSFSPTSDMHWYVYGIDSFTDLTMPFNRADYYISTNNVPQRCAPGTGVLVKSILRQDTGTFGKEFPLLECVASFQIVLGVDTAPNDGLVEKHCLTNNITTVPGIPNPITPDVIRNQVQEIRIYILAQEGDFDRDYSFNNFTSGTSILVGENDPSDCDRAGADTGTQSCNCSGTDGVLGDSLDLSTLGPTYRNYRWRLYRMVLKPETTLIPTNTGG